MASNKKPRKKGSAVRRKADHIGAVVNRCMSKFHMIGDMNHLPTAFHFADISLHLKGMDMKIAVEHAWEFLSVHRKPWTMMGFFFFKEGEEISVIPQLMTIPDTVVNEVGAYGEDYLRTMRESIYSDNPELSDDKLEFYGYYFTHGSDLRIETIEDKLCDAFMKITNDLTDVKPHVVQITEQKVLDAIINDRYHLVDHVKAGVSQMHLKG